MDYMYCRTLGGQTHWLYQYAVSVNVMYIDCTALTILSPWWIALLDCWERRSNSTKSLTKRQVLQDKAALQTLMWKQMKLLQTHKWWTKQQQCCFLTIPNVHAPLPTAYAAYDKKHFGSFVPKYQYLNLVKSSASTGLHTISVLCWLAESTAQLARVLGQSSITQNPSHCCLHNGYLCGTTNDPSNGENSTRTLASNAKVAIQLLLSAAILPIASPYAWRPVATLPSYVASTPTWPSYPCCLCHI